MDSVRTFIISATVLGSVVFGQAALPFGTDGNSGSAGFSFGPAAQQQEYYSITAKASVSGYKVGESFYIAMNGKVADTYHAYWRNPGTVGLPIEAKLIAPEGFRVEGPYWEVPHLVKGDFSAAYSYEAPIAVWKVTPEAHAPQQAEFSIQSTAQTCNDMGCNAPETKTATLSLAAGDGAAAADWAAEETKTEVLGDSAINVTATQTAEAVTLTISGVAEIANAYFFSEDNSINPMSEQALAKTDHAYTLTLPRNDNSDSLHPVADESLVGKELVRLSGILTVNGTHTSVNICFGATPPAPEEETDTPQDGEATTKNEEDVDAVTEEEEEDAEDEEEDAEDEEEDAEEETEDEDASTPASSTTTTNFGGGFGLFGDSAATPQEYFSISGKASVNAYTSGKAFYIAMNGKVADTYHAYWRNPGTVGQPVTATLSAPAGFKVEGPYWEVPHLVKGEYSTAYSYEAPLAVWKVTPEANAPQQAEFTITGTAQTCNDMGCNAPETKTATVTLSAGEATPHTSWAAEESKVETLGDTPVTVTASQTPDTVTLTITGVENIADAYFFSADNSINPTGEQVLAKTENAYTLTLPRNDNSDTLHPVADESLVGKELTQLVGLLTFDGRHATVSIQFGAPAATPVAPQSKPAEEPAAAQQATATAQTEATQQQSTAPAPAPESTTEGGEQQSFLLIIGSLFLGGLILNFMPCVFPVIGLKIMSFVEMGGGNRRKVFTHSAIFAFGIILSFLILAILLAVFTDAETRSWAMWMQNPWVVYGILLLLLILGLSMFGLFEIGVGATGAGQNLQNKDGLLGSFFQGIFITIVATPCSAPFLATAIPPALALPNVGMLSAFCFMGLGLAFPYIVLGAFPKLLRFLPQPGAWMETLKQGLSFLLFAAAAWFVYIYMGMINQDAVMMMLIGLTIIAAAFWMYGRWCPIYQSFKTRLYGGIVAIITLAIGVYISIPLSLPVAETEANAPAATAAVGNKFNASTSYSVSSTVWGNTLMQEALQKGHPVLVDYSGQWTGIYDALGKNNVVVMHVTPDNLSIPEAADADIAQADYVMYAPTVTIDTKYYITIEVFTAAYLHGFLQEHLADFSAPNADTRSADYVVCDGKTATWNNWSPAIMEAALKDGHPVYVDFTAKWCATCQTNKKVAYSDEVLQKFAQHEVVLMKADKTNPSEIIDAEMKRLQRSQVPTNALYIPGNTTVEQQAIPLKQATTPQDMEQFLNSTLSGNAARVKINYIKG